MKAVRATLVVTGSDLRIRRWVNGGAPIAPIDEGSSLAEVLPVDRRDATIEQVLRALRDTGAFTGEWPCCTASGDVADLPVSAVAIATESGSPDALVFAIDSSSRASDDEVDRHRRMVENASEAILVAQDGRIRFANPECVRVLGQSPEALMSTPFIQFIHPEDRALVLDRHVRRLRGEQQPDEYSFRVIDSKGGTRWVDIRAVVTIWEGRPATFNFLRDVTIHKTVLAEKVQLEERLDQSQKMESLGRLAGGVAHDINNVLAAIMGFVSVWKDELGSDARIAADVDEVLRACERGRDLASNLLGYARQGTYTMEPLSLNAVVGQVEHLLRHSLGKNVSVRTHLDPQLPLIVGDATQLSHALVNLCLNAADAMSSGGTLTLATSRSDARNVRPDLPDPEQGSYVVLEVVDTGCGMSPETMARAFEPFFTTKPKGQGTGLGLSMAYGTVKSHGGSMTIDSELGGGTMITIVFPVTDQIRSRPSSPPEARPTLAGPLDGKILIVDDEAMVRRATTRLLERLGYRVVTVESGEKAVEVVAADSDGSIALVLLDLVMPGIDGAETFRRLRRIRPPIRVLLCSGYSREQSVQGLLNTGAVGFLRKPFSIEQIADAIRAAIEPIVTTPPPAQ